MLRSCCCSRSPQTRGLQTTLFSHGSGGQKCHSKVSAGLSPENHHLCVFQSFIVMLISIPLGIVLATLEALPLGVLLGPSSP